jgi:hypothetical protein
MTLPVRFSLLHSDLNDFLLASVGEEQNGVTLSVVSATRRRSRGRGCPAHPLRRGRLRPRRSRANCLIAEPSTAVMSAGARSSSLSNRKSNEILGSADRDSRATTNWCLGIWDAEATDYSRSCPRSHRALASSLARRDRHVRTQIPRRPGG